MALSSKDHFNLSDFPFHYDLETRWKDMDAFGHVNNAVFLTYIEDARITFFKRWKLDSMDKGLIVASAKIDFLHQLIHPTKLVIGQRISRIGGKSFDIESVIYNHDGMLPIASSVIICVCFNYNKNQSVPVYPEIINDYK